jgi:hypothetical protein
MPDTTYTLKGLMDRIGPVTDDEVMLFVEGCDRGELIKKGKGVGTSRITTDGPRLYGTSLDFLENATQAQREAVAGLSVPLLKAAIHAVHRGEELYQQLRTTKNDKSGGRAVDSVTVDKARATLVADRDVLYETLSTLAAGDRTWQTKIERAYGTMATPKDLKKSLTDLSVVARAMLADASPQMTARRATVAIDEAKLARLNAAAADYATAAAQAAAPMTSAAVSQADVDYWDGINLYLLRRIINIHEAGNVRDPSVPRLIPISLRNLFRHAVATAIDEPTAVLDPAALAPK